MSDKSYKAGSTVYSTVSSTEQHKRTIKSNSAEDRIDVELYQKIEACKKSKKNIKTPPKEMKSTSNVKNQHNQNIGIEYPLKENQQEDIDIIILGEIRN